MAGSFIKPDMPKDNLLNREPTEAELKSFRRAAHALNKLGRAGFHIYLANDTLNLMVGPSHDSRHCPAQDRVREAVTVCRAGGGDW